MGLEKLKGCLRSISIRQYTSAFFYKGKTSQSSVAGGIITLVVGTIFLIASVLILNDIINATNFNLKEEAFQINTLRCCTPDGKPYNTYNSTNSGNRHVVDVPV